MIAKLRALLLNDASFLFISTIIVNAGNYGINLVLGRVLGPTEFAEASILATAVLMLSFIAVGFQLTAAKYSATYQAERDNDKYHTLINWLSRHSYILGFGLSFVLLLAVYPIKSFLQFKSVVPLILVIICIPIYFHLSVSRGALQGIEKFKNLAFTYISEMAARLVVTFILVFTVIKMSGGWTSEAISIGFLVSFVITYFVSKQKKVSTQSKLPSEDLSLIYKFVFVIGIYEFSQILINNSDIILVKHYFENEQAGLYAALALIGRVVFFATWTIVTLLFPKVIQKEQKGEKHSHLFWGSLLIVGGIGCSIIIACLLMDELIINILFGSAYLSVSPLLWKYAVATTLFACANVFVYYYMSLNKYFPVALSVTAGITQVGLIVFFHDSIEQVITVQILLMAGLLLAMILYYISENDSKKTTTSKDQAQLYQLDKSFG